MSLLHLPLYLHRWKELRDRIAALPSHHFAMRFWACEWMDTEARTLMRSITDLDSDEVIDLNRCGTAACLAGWALTMKREEAGTRPAEARLIRFGDGWGLDDEAGSWLGLNEAEATRLFRGGWDRRFSSNGTIDFLNAITAAEAVAFMDFVIAAVEEAAGTADIVVDVWALMDRYRLAERAKAQRVAAEVQP